MEPTPHTGKFVAYYRVSTDKQGEHGLGMDVQRQRVKDFLNGGKWSLIGEFTEIESGTRKRLKNRPILAAAIELARKQKAVLVVAKLDRLARDVQFISTLLNSNVKFLCVDMPSADRTMLHMLSVFAEHEARIISARTKAALSELKKKGKKLGSPSPQIGSDAAMIVIKKQADDYANRVGPIVQDIIKKTGAKTMREIAEALTARGVQTPRGRSDWYASQVANLLNRIKKM